MTITHLFGSRARRAAVISLLAGPLALGACSNLTDELLEPQQPQVITPEEVSAAGPTAADALRVGALGWLRLWTGGGGDVNQENAWMMADLLTDVWKSSDTFTQRNDTDRRDVTTNNALIAEAYSRTTRSRGYYRAAIDALGPVVTTDKEAKIAEMYFALGYTEMMLAEIFCNGIPLGETKAGVVTYTAPLSNEQVYNVALTHLDSAITLASGTSALAVSVKNAAMVAKGRTLVNLGKFSEAAAAVQGLTASWVDYRLTFSQLTQSNEIWALNYNRSNARYTVGDSADHVGRILNALPFATAKDPRVPVQGSTAASALKGIDNVTPWVGQLLWTARESPVVLVSTIDARLIEAEARLQGNDIAGMMSILNALRASPQNIGPVTVPAMAALATPADREAAIDLFFREKAFWQFARGARLGDLRRLVRQYKRPQDRVYPVGTFHKEGRQYGGDINLPVTDNELNNPNFKGCSDRAA